ncbi:hypothetical protein L227DRAFT_586614 [Lentinus tigrinus ALCF2SS1-6]|uniref:Aspartic peptidase DDI1-type domain-containing protein n=1 Tax=Lentinus tigrinus ALCF2SS1-6 TaxID=1328759 RepID=A0A5C2S6K4_9APHY|nr:hypothetical protein L227DRAFT_586614 [Lentinus tigrinus ALCF2SS1-6]
MAQPYRMPPRGGAGAPSFDPNNDARSIIGFFEDLEYNFQQAGVSSPREKKAHAVRYAPDSEKTIWKSYPEFEDPLKSYDDFKKAILAEYIGEGGRMLYTLRDLDMLVRMTAAAGVHSIKEFNDYSRKFRDIASFLVTGNYLRDDERDRMFIQGISEPLRGQVTERLRITHPDVLYPRQQYSVPQVTEAVRHILEAAVPSEDPVPLRVALESAAIRAVEGVFMSKRKVSCILDSGSAIVSMSEGVCHALGLDYDHRITLEMQSANGELDNSLGLARNVPVRFGSLVVYLQFHVIRSPAYDVLLGRPFDILTSSIVQTNSDGSQTIILHDPNSDIETTIPTHRRIDPQYSRSLCSCPECVPGFYSWAN